MSNAPATLARAAKFHDYKWPENLWTGVMFFDGARISLKEFTEYVEMWKRSTL